MRVEEINLIDRDVFAKGVPHEWFTYLRQHDPIFHHDEPDGPGFWVLSRHADVRAVSRDPVTYSSDPVTPLEEEAIPVFVGAKVLIVLDPPAHTSQRKLVNHGFTPRVINALESHVRELTVRIVDRAVAMGRCDFVTDVAAELPVEVIAELLGVPRADRHKVFEWTNRSVGFEDPEYFPSTDPTERANWVMEAGIEMFSYVQALCEERRTQPRDDIVSTLVQAGGDNLTDAELASFVQFLYSAGNETTRNAAAHGLSAFLDRPEEWEKLVQDPEGLIAGATEEILRWASPVMYQRRNVTRDTELAGQTFKAGDKVSLWYISANRDEDVFEDPFRFNIERRPNDHIAFGGGGPHFCLGASLARLEIRILFEELARRVPVLEGLGPPSYLRSNVVAGIKHLPVDLSPR